MGGRIWGLLIFMERLMAALGLENCAKYTRYERKAWLHQARKNMNQHCSPTCRCPGLFSRGCFKWVASNLWIVSVDAASDCPSSKMRAIFRHDIFIYAMSYTSRIYIIEVISGLRLTGDVLPMWMIGAAGGMRNGYRRARYIDHRIVRASWMVGGGGRA